MASNMEITREMFEKPGNMFKKKKIWKSDEQCRKIMVNLGLSTRNGHVLLVIFIFSIGKKKL